jgi:hypothetical protein
MLEVVLVEFYLEVYQLLEQVAEALEVLLFQTEVMQLLIQVVVEVVLVTVIILAVKVVQELLL